MTDVMPEQIVHSDDVAEQRPADGPDAVDEQLIARLAGRARQDGLALTGEGGLLAQLTKRMVESALEGEITGHLGYDRAATPPAAAAVLPQRPPLQDGADRGWPGRDRRPS